MLFLSVTNIVFLYFPDRFPHLQLSNLMLQFLLLLSGLDSLHIQTFDLSHPSFHVQLQLPQLLVQLVLEPYLSGYLVLKQLDLLLHLQSERQSRQGSDWEFMHFAFICIDTNTAAYFRRVSNWIK